MACGERSRDAPCPDEGETACAASPMIWRVLPLHPTDTGDLHLPAGGRLTNHNGLTPPSTGAGVTNASRVETASQVPKAFPDAHTPAVERSTTMTGEKQILFVHSAGPQAAMRFQGEPVQQPQGGAFRLPRATWRTLKAAKIRSEALLLSRARSCLSRRFLAWIPPFSL